MDIAKLQEAAKALDTHISKETDTLPFSSERGFTAVEIKKENFHELPLFSQEKSITAVDGGNGTLLESPSLVIEIIKVAAATYEGKKRSSHLSQEFLCLVQARQEKGNLSFECSFIGDGVFDTSLVFASMMETLDGEKVVLEIDQVPSLVRRYAELIFASAFTDGVLVMDGSIKVKTEEELGYLRQLISSNDHLCFVSKSSQLLTKNANALQKTLHESGPKSSWYYYPLFEINSRSYPGDLVLAKLHTSSKHVFPIGIPKKESTESIIFSLSQQATDPVLFGYPYCLVEADKLARVSNKDKDYYRTLLLSSIKEKEKLGYLLSSSDVHSVLDKISF